MNARPHDSFEPFNRGFAQVFQPTRLSVGLVVPIERYDRSRVPTMAFHLEKVRLAEDLGFQAVWLRDVPFDVPTFGDAGQLFDPFVYLGVLAASTHRIALGVASIVLPLRHPVHVAKAAASVDVLSDGRLILGVASGDRPTEYPAFAIPYEDRSARFRDAITYIRDAARPSPVTHTRFGRLDGSIELHPKPTAGRLPLLVTGSSRQSPEWIAEHSDGWMTYPRAPDTQAQVLADWRHRVAETSAHPKPVMQPLYIDLLDDDHAAIQPFHLGIRTGSRGLVAWLQALEAAGVHHVAFNLRFNRAPIDHTLHRIAEHVLPHLDRSTP